MVCTRNSEVKSHALMMLLESGDLRNVVTTLASIPSSYQGHISCVINDSDKIASAKNYFLLKALVLEDDEVAAAETILNLWYSGHLPSSELDEYRKVTSKSSSTPHFNSEFKEDGMFKEVITHAGYRLQLVSTWKENDLPIFPANLPLLKYAVAEASRKVAITGLNKYTDVLQLHYELRLKPHQRVADARFRQYSILRPFGARDTHQYVLNPSVYSILERAQH